MRIQGLLDSDIAISLDVCPPGGAARQELLPRSRRRRAGRCAASRARNRIRRCSASCRGAPTSSCASGMRASSRPCRSTDWRSAVSAWASRPRAMHAALTEIVPHLPERRPRYLMGVGTPADIVHAIAQGVDLFDCVLPTRNARNGQAFISGGKLVVKNARYKNDPLPLDPRCECPVCAAGYTRSYIRHLYVAGEIFALRLLTLHNVHFTSSSSPGRGVRSWPDPTRSGWPAGARCAVPALSTIDFGAPPEKVASRAPAFWSARRGEPWVKVTRRTSGASRCNSGPRRPRTRSRPAGVSKSKSSRP